MKTSASDDDQFEIFRVQIHFAVEHKLDEAGQQAGLAQTTLLRFWTGTGGIKKCWSTRAAIRERHISFDLEHFLTRVVLHVLRRHNPVA